MFTKGHVGNRDPSLVGKGGMDRGIGAYSKSPAPNRPDPRITESGDYREPAKSHARQLDDAQGGASASRKVQPVSGGGGLSAPLPGGVRSGGGGLSRPTAKPARRTYEG